MTGQTREQVQHEQARTRVEQATAPSPDASFDEPMPAADRALREAKAQSAFQVGAEQRASGRSGERNLQLKFTDVWIGSARSGRFAIQTATGHALEVMIEQSVYRRTYSGTSTLETSVLPVAPIGTQGKIVVRDTTSGEELVRPYCWIDIGQGGGLWEMIKRLFWKG